MSRVGRVAASLGPVLPAGRGGASGLGRGRRRERPAGPFPGSRDCPCPAGLPGPTAPPPGLGQAGGAGAAWAGWAPLARGPGQSRRARCLRGDALLCFAFGVASLQADGFLPFPAWSCPNKSCSRPHRAVPGVPGVRSCESLPVRRESAGEQDRSSP